MAKLSRSLIGAGVAIVVALGCGTGEGSRESVGQVGEALLTGSGKCKTANITTNHSQSYGGTQTIFVPPTLELTQGTTYAAKCETALTFASALGTTHCYYAEDAGLQVFKLTYCERGGVIASERDPWGPVTSVSLGSVVCDDVANFPVGSVPTARAIVGPTELDNPCRTVTCDPASGIHSSDQLPDGTACDDGAFCNGAETCQSGICKHPADPITGDLIFPVGQVCSDGNVCNGLERCDANGQCGAGAPLPVSAFDDHNNCTTDSCDPNRGIVNEPSPTCGVPPGAPTQEPNAITPFGDSTEFLYSGASPIQTGVAPGTIDKSIAGVIRGRVFATNGTSPMSGVSVSILNHPEYGQTTTRTDGYYDIAVNAGPVYVVDIGLTGYLPIQRQARTKPLDWAMVDDAVLTAPYTSPDPFVPGAATGKMVVGQTTPVNTDADGARTAVVYFPPQTRTPNFTVADGTNLSVELTEYTVADGERRMPGTLPATSGYTYAFEVTLPAARAAGIQDVTFDKDVAIYVDNFISTTVGKPVPLGYYDRNLGAWVAEKSGKTVRIVSITGGLADVDTDEVAGADNTGIDNDERAALAAQYPDAAITPRSLWRVAVRHFSAWDANWGFGPPPGARNPPRTNPKDDNPDKQCEVSGSIIGCEGRTLGESVPIVGTPFNLRYASDRTRGFEQRVTLRLTDSTPLDPMPDDAQIIIDVAGNRYQYLVGGAWGLGPDSYFTWSWDGVDALGRAVEGSHEARILIGYQYSATRNFGTPTFGGGGGGGGYIDGNRAARKITLWTESKANVARHESKPVGLGGWSLDANHFLDPSGILYFGDGHKRSSLDLRYDVTHFAGTRTYSSATTAEGIPAVDAWLGDAQITGVVAAKDGSVYVSNYPGSGDSNIRRIGRDGIVNTVAGLPPTVAKTDGGNALHAKASPMWMVGGPDGSIYFSELHDSLANPNTVWRLDTQSPPKLHLVAGNGSGCVTPPCGDGGDAKLAQLSDPKGLAVDDDGTVYIAEGIHVRRVDPKGTITTFFTAVSGDEQPQWVTMGPAGSLYMRRAGNDVFQLFPGALGTGTNAVLLGNKTLWCDDGGGTYDGDGRAVRGGLIIACYGRLHQLALDVANPNDHVKKTIGGRPGTTGETPAVDDGPALNAAFAVIRSMDIAANGDVYVADTGHGVIRRLRRPVPSSSLNRIRHPSTDGSLVYEFEGNTGRHLRTLSGLTGATLLTFTYDPTSNELASITDDSSNVTSFSRAGGNVTITAPHGQVTTLTLDANGYIASIQNPNAETLTLTHDSTGLLTSRTDARGNQHKYFYTYDGRLDRDVDAAPGSQGKHATASDTSQDSWTTGISTAEGRLTTHKVDRGSLPGGAIERRTVTRGPLVTTTDTWADERSTTTAPDGTVTTITAMAGDPRWKGLVSYPAEATTTAGTHSFSTKAERTASLSDPSDPTTVTTATFKKTLSGMPTTATTTSTYTAGSPSTWLHESAESRKVQQQVDSQGRVIEVSVLGSDPVTLYPVQLTYDAGRIATVTHGSRLYTTSYDGAGWVSATTAPEGLGTSIPSRDPNGRPQTVVLPGPRQVGFSYDAGGNLTTVTTPTSKVHGFDFGPNDELARYMPPDTTPTMPVRDTTYQVNFDGQSKFIGYPTNAFQAFTYDTLGRLLSTTEAISKSFQRDPQGRLTSMGSGDGVTTSFSYDGPLVTTEQITGPFTGTLARTWDNYLRVASVGIDGNAPIVLGYDKDNAITAASGPVAMSLARGDTGLLKGTTADSISDTYSYNPYGEVIGYSVTGSATGYSLAYDRDTAGRIHTITETIGGVSKTIGYEYDTAGRLAQVYENGVLANAWPYDDNGNRNGVTVDEQDRLTSDGTNYTYNENGDLLTRTPLGGPTRTFNYDANGNLRSTSEGANAITYQIDAANRRVAKSINGVLAQGFIYDGSRIVAEVDGAGAVVSEFFYVTGSHSPDLMLKGGTKYRILKDHLGSPRLVVSTSGALAQRLDYDAWGNVIADTAAGFQPFGFAGGLYDRDTKLVRFGARDYDPATGRWTTKDASRFAGGLNFYGYANNDPVNYIDIDGHNPGAAEVIGMGIVLLWFATQVPDHEAHSMNAIQQGVFMMMTAGAAALAERALSACGGVGAAEAAQSGGGGIGVALGGGGGGGGPAARFIAGPGGSVIETGLTPSELLMPGGARIGQAGASRGIRVIQGGATEAGMMFDQLSAGGTPYVGNYGGTAFTVPGGGFVGLRTFSTGTGARMAPAATIDVGIPGIRIGELKFVP